LLLPVGSFYRINVTRWSGRSTNAAQWRLYKWQTVVVR